MIRRFIFILEGRELEDEVEEDAEPGALGCKRDYPSVAGDEAAWGNV